MIVEKAFALGAGAVALVAVTAAGIFAWQAHRADKALELCSAAKATLETKVDEQNRSIERHAAVASAALAQASQALAAAEQVTKARQGQIAALQTALKAAPGMSCTDAVKRVREGLKP